MVHFLQFSEARCLSLFKVFVLVLTASALFGCGQDDQSAVAPTGEQSTSAVKLTPTQQELFDRTCKSCHGVAGTGAPGIGDQDAWADRNEQGLETLVDHTINGYGGMPPMGLCMECTQDEFVAFISYMSGLECEPLE